MRVKSKSTFSLLIVHFLMRDGRDMTRFNEPAFKSWRRKNFFALSSSKLRNVLCASVPKHPLGQLFGIAVSYLLKWREICACCANNTRENKMDSVFPVFAVREPEVSFYYAKQFICYISLLFFKSVEKQLQTEHMQCGDKSVRRNLLHEDRAWKSWD